MRFPIALCALVLVLGCQSDEERRAEHAQRAAEYYEAEQWKEAKIEYLNLLQLDAESAEANYRLAEVQRRLGEFGDALWRYREAVRLAPERADWRARFAALLIQAQRADEAREQVDLALEQDPECVEALVLRARLHAADAELDLALERIDQVLELTRDFKAAEDDAQTEEERTERGLRHAAYTVKAQIQLNQQDYEGAEQTLRAFASDFPDPGPHLLLAVFLVDRERPDEAQAEYAAAVEAADVEDDRLRAQFAMAGFLFNRGDTEGAERVLNEAREAAPERPEPLLQLGNLYARAGRNEEAAGMLEAIAAQQPDQVGPLLALSNFYRIQGDPDRAMEAIDRALLIDPKHEQVRLARAEFLMERRDEDPAAADEARALVDTILEENPDSTLGLFTKAKFELIDGENVSASNRLRRVVQDSPSSLAHVMLATAYQRMGQPDLARSELLAAIQLDEANLTARRALAQLHMEAGNYPLAIQEADAALRRDPSHQGVALLRARALAADGQLSEARAALDALEYAEGSDSNPLRLAASLLYLQLRAPEQANALIETVLQNEPTNASALKLWATQKASAGASAEGLARIEQALEASPDDARLYELRAALNLAIGGPPDQGDALRERVMRDLETSIEKDPTRAEPWVLKASLYRLDGRFEDADEALEKAIEINPSGADAFVMRAELLERRGEKARARAAYEALLEEHPDHSMAKNNLAWLLADGETPTPEDLDRAQDLAQDAKEAFPDNAAIADTLGWVMLKKGIPRAAIPLFREAIGKSPNSVMRATVRYHLALAYEEAGDSEKAIAELEIAIAEDESFPNRGDAVVVLERLRAG